MKLLAAFTSALLLYMCTTVSGVALPVMHRTRQSLSATILNVPGGNLSLALPLAAEATAPGGNGAPDLRP